MVDWCVVCGTKVSSRTVCVRFGTFALDAYYSTHSPSFLVLKFFALYHSCKILRCFELIILREMVG